MDTKHRFAAKNPVKTKPDWSLGEADTRPFYSQELFAHADVPVYPIWGRISPTEFVTLIGGDLYVLLVESRIRHGNGTPARYWRVEVQRILGWWVKDGATKPHLKVVLRRTGLSWRDAVAILATVVRRNLIVYEVEHDL